MKQCAHFVRTLTRLRAHVTEECRGIHHASDMSADVVVVGAGPGRSSTAYHLARAGLDVVLLEKSRSRATRSADSPTAVHELIAMSVGFQQMRNRGLTSSVAIPSMDW